MTPLIWIASLLLVGVGAGVRFYSEFSPLPAGGQH
jgi:hypothetical protein